jgi:hypothetical protein
VRFVELRGVEGHEAALVVRRRGGTTLILNDLVGNIHDAHGIGGVILHAAGFAGVEPRIPRVVKKKIVDDEHALAAQLEEWADLPSLTRIIVSHGSPIEANASGTLRSLARSLQ